MFETLRNAWKIADLRKKFLYTLLIILIFRIGSAITVPFVDVSTLENAIMSLNGSIDPTTNASTVNFMDYLNMISGGGFPEASIFALSITPYINASIIIQLLTVAIPPLEKLAKEGEAGRKTLNKITRFTTIGLGLLLGIAYYFMIRNKYNALISTATKGAASWFAAVVIVLCFVAGSALVMWLGEQINEKGIGNGISILLFAGILSSIPDAVITLWTRFYTYGIQMLNTQYASYGITNVIIVPVVLVLFLAIIGLIVFTNDAERRIPVQYAKRVVGRKMYGGQNSFIPIKVNMSGVMPIILASSIISMPSILASFFNWKTNWFLAAFSSNSWIYIFVYFFLIIGFAYFYVTIQYNPIEMANNLRQNGGAIPGQRPGRPTSDFIKRVLNKVTLIGALFLGFIALFPSIFGKFSGFYELTLGGTSIMIVVGVALETTQQIESQMMMRHYKGFLG